MEDEVKRQQPFTKPMALTLQVEEAALTAISTWFLTRYSMGLSFWLWLPLFFSPDLAMLGYLVNTRVGAFTYNLVHHRAIGAALATAGYFMHTDILVTIGLLLFAHSSFDRMLGYGLKYGDSFSHTSSGWIGKSK